MSSHHDLAVGAQPRQGRCRLRTPRLGRQVGEAHGVQLLGYLMLRRAIILSKHWAPKLQSKLSKVERRG
jgi:hypothetical protein